MTPQALRPDRSPAEIRPTNQRRQRRTALRWVGAVCASLVILLIAGGLLLRKFGPEYARQQMEQSLRDRFQGDLRYSGLDIAVFPSLRLSLHDVTIHLRGRSDVPPLIYVRHAVAEGHLLRLILSGPHVAKIHLEGLTITVPPRDERATSQPHSGTRSSNLVIDRLESDDCTLRILPTDPRRQPLEFDLHHLLMRDVSANRPASFTAQLSNPEPRGEIQVKGDFGPWQPDDPGATPVRADYTFTHADLATFKGIGGILKSTGKFHGVLERIEAEGETDTPAFYLRLGGHPLPLHTTFHSIIDGTNGNTWLQPVNAQLRASAMVATGGVVGSSDVKGRRIFLDVSMPRGRLEDLLRLAIKGDPTPMSGLAQFNCKLVIPPGEQDIAEKLELDGEFSVAAARFASLDIRQKLESLSRRALGQPNNEEVGSAITNLRGRFQLRNGSITFSQLMFAIEGATLNLTGTYALESQQMDLHGTAQLDAKLSQTTTGFKSLLLKAVDPFFRGKHGGALLGIKITGDRSHPSFGLDLSKK